MKTEVDLSGSKILLVDDTPENLRVLRRMLESQGYVILVATGGEAAIRIAENAQPDLILLDVVMPDIDGFETCGRLKHTADTRDIPVIFVTARTESTAVIKGFEVGGVDYIVKPFKDEEVIARVETHLKIDRLARALSDRNDDLTRVNESFRQAEAARKQVTEERDKLEDQLSMAASEESRRWGIQGFVGRSQAVKNIAETVGKIQNVETTVLVTGENGAGKELIARAIHASSPRAEKPFVALNCAAIPAELAESTLFGHVRGAFTGADRDRKGYFKLAEGGTLFLDEIGEMSSDLQAKLLRVLEDRMVMPVGGAEETHVDVRILAATNVDMQDRVQSGAFRQDLFFRLAQFTVTVPPLRSRREDISLLARHFVDLFAGEMGLQSPEISDEAIQRLRSHDWPGNVRELKNVAERALIESGGAAIEVTHLHLQPFGGNPGTPLNVAGEFLPMNLKEAETYLINRALEQTDQNITATAKLLGTNRMKIYKHLEDGGERVEGQDQG